MAIQAVNFGNEPQTQRSGGSGVPVVTTLAGGAIGAFGIGEKITSKDVLNKDKFELSKKATDADKTVEKSINDTRTEYTQEKIKATADAEAAKILNGKTELTVEEYLGKSAEDFGKDIEAEKGKTAGLEKTATEAKEAFDKADDAGKEASKTTKEAAEEALSKHKNAIADMEAKADVAKAAKDGKISKEAIESKALKDVVKKGQSEIDGLLAKLSKIPKKTSIKFGVIGAAVGLVLGLILRPKHKSTPQA